MDNGNGCGMCGNPQKCSSAGYCLTDYELYYDKVYLWRGGRVDRSEIESLKEEED